MLAKSRSARTQGSVAALVITLVSVGVALLLLMNRQVIIDRVTVWQYEPSAQVQSFATRAGMSDTGEFYFFASRPLLNNQQEFNKNCPNSEPQTAILGCYAAQRIYIYDVPTGKLKGIRTVTAAHEMLHAVYERFDENERQRINSLLETEYNKLKSDTKLAERMAYYAKTEPGERSNELFAIIGTEVPEIGSELEAYYRHYFDDRQKVVSLHAGYQSVFNQLQTRAEQLKKQLDSLRVSIEQNSDAYNDQVTQLNGDILSFNERADNEGFESQSEFDQERSSLLARADQLDAYRNRINDDIAEFDALQDELASIASQSDALNRSINSSLAPAPSL
jgi:hypothetical protein